MLIVQAASAVTPSVTTFDTGSGNFTVPAYNTMVIEIWGAGAPGGQSSPQGKQWASTTASIASIGLSMVSQGGWSPAGSGTGAGGVGGTASGGDVNTTGNTGGSGVANAGVVPAGGKGADAPNGGTGGAGGIAAGTTNVLNPGQPGTVPGAGGGGFSQYQSGLGRGNAAAGGGSSAYCKKTLTFGVNGPSVGDTIAYAVAALSAGLTGQGNGAGGRVKITIT